MLIQIDQIFKVQTHHKIVVLGGLCHEFWSALSNPDTDLHVPSILALLCFPHLTYNPVSTHNVIIVECVRRKKTWKCIYRHPNVYVTKMPIQKPLENAAALRLAGKCRADYVIRMDLNLC